MTTIETQIIAMPSRTALIAAAYRAAHQKLEGGKIFADPLAQIILGNEGIAVVDEAEAGRSRPIRLFIAARSRSSSSSKPRARCVPQGSNQIGPCFFIGWDVNNLDAARQNPLAVLLFIVAVSGRPSGW